MSGFGRGGKGGHGGRGTSSISALRKGMAAKKNQNQLVPKPGGSSRAVETSASSSSEETFQLSFPPQGASQFAMMIRLTPGLLDDLRRAEAQGGVSNMKFGVYPTGNLIKVGQEEFKFSSASEHGNLCDVCEERAGEDGQGVLAVVGSAWRKLSVQRTLSASEKDRVKKRSVEAEQQSKSRKAIVLDSSMKPEAPSGGEALGRRPPLKAKREPPVKKRKVTPAVPPPSAKTKPPPAHTVPVPPVKDKAGAGSASALDEPVVAPSSTAPLTASIAAVTSAPQLPQAQSVNLENPPLVEEITIGASPHNNNAVHKEREKPQVATPEVKAPSGTLSMNDLRNNIIMLLTENQRGLTLKAVEKALGNVAPQPARKNIEKILKSIASYHAPGKYILNPGVKPETIVKPSPGSCSLPDAAADSPGSSAKLAESKDHDADSNRSEKEKEEVRGVEIERIDIGEGTPSKSSSFEQAMQYEGGEHTGTPEGAEHPGTSEGDITMTDGQVPPVDNDAPKPVGSSGSGTSSSSSGSESDSDSDSDSSGSSGSESGSSSDEDEHVDIVSDDERSRPKSSRKGKADEETSDEVHKESEDIDIGDADDSCKLDAVVEKLTETISLEVEDIPCGDGLDETDVKTSEELHQRHEDDRGNQSSGGEKQHPSPEMDVSRAEKRWSPPRVEKHRSPSRAEKHWSPPRAEKHWSPSRAEKYRSPAPASRSGKELSHKTPKRTRDEIETQARSHELPASRAAEMPRHRASPRHRMPRAQPDSRRHEAADQGYQVESRSFERSSRDDNRSTQKPDTRPEVEPVKKPTEETMDTELELGEFRESTPETLARSLPVKASTPEEVTRSRPFRETTPELVPRREDTSKTRSEVKGPGQSHAKKHDSGVSKKPAEESIPLARKPVETNPRATRAPQKGAELHAGSARMDTEVKAKKNSSADAKSKDSSGDSIQSKSTEFFAPYEKDFAELKGPIKSYEQYKDYVREYNEKYDVYIQLNNSLEVNREIFENFQRELDLANSSGDRGRVKSIEEQIKQKYRQCRKRHKRMQKTFVVLHNELKAIKVQLADYARQTCT